MFYWFGVDLCCEKIPFKCRPSNQRIYYCCSSSNIEHIFYWKRYKFWYPHQIIESTRNTRTQIVIRTAEFDIKYTIHYCFSQNYQALLILEVYCGFVIQDNQMGIQLRVFTSEYIEINKHRIYYSIDFPVFCLIFVMHTSRLS